MLYFCNTLRWAWLDWGLSGWLTTLLFQCFDAVGWVIRLVKTVGRITCIGADVKPCSINYVGLLFYQLLVFQTAHRNFEYFCQISSKSITIILSYTVSKLVHFWDTVYILFDWQKYLHDVMWCTYRLEVRRSGWSNNLGAWGHDYVHYARDFTLFLLVFTINQSVLM